MADTMTTEQRSRTMRAVRSRDTQPERALRRALWAAGARGWRCHWRAAPGNPDLAWPGKKVAVFVDGAFWHGHPDRYWRGRSGAYWDDKIERNRARDKRTDAALLEAGWACIRLWDFEVLDDPARSAEKVIGLLENVGRKARANRD